MIEKSQSYQSVARLLNCGDLKAAKKEFLVIEGLSREERQEIEGNFLFEEGLHKEAVLLFQNVIKENSDYTIARYYYLAAIQNERSEDYGAAFDYYRAAIEAEPIYAAPYIDLAGFLVKVDDADGAIKCLERAVEHDPYDIVIFENLLTLYGKKKDTDELFKSKFDKLKKELPILQKRLKPVRSNSRW